jgi:hypothetical protein
MTKCNRLLVRNCRWSVEAALAKDHQPIIYHRFIKQQVLRRLEIQGSIRSCRKTRQVHKPLDSIGIPAFAAILDIFWLMVFKLLPVV